MPPTNATCTNCGHQFQAPDFSAGQEIRCPFCLIAMPSAPGNSARVSAAPNKTVLAEPEAMIRYTCPKCKRALESPVSFAGQKLNCPGCNQRLQIPNTPAPAAAPPINKTILATASGAPEEIAPSSRYQEPPEVVPEVEAAPRPAAPVGQRESCLECGIDVTKRKRVQTCPDCGSLFCSAQCYREHRYHAHDKKQKKRPRDVECEYCGSNRRPYINTAVTEGGWVTFALLLVFFFPLCWLGLLMTETRVTCSDCGKRLE